MIVSAMLCASLSSVVLSTFMSSLVLVSRRFRINPGMPLVRGFAYSNHPRIFDVPPHQCHTDVLGNCLVSRPLPCSSWIHTSRMEEPVRQRIAL
jgi:hypothetical protein